MTARHGARPGPGALFARAYDRLVPVMDARGAGEHRSLLLEGLTGDVVEVGAGSAATFPHYPPTVRQITAVEPHPGLRALAQSRTGSCAAPAHVVAGDAGHLPLADACADAVIFSLVLCSVPDPLAALREARRVVRPGGTLRLYEHVRPGSRTAAFAATAATVLWRHLAGGCHLDRDPVATALAAGWVREDLRELRFAPLPGLPAVPHVLLRARA